jgi:hypothetical protein
MSPILGRELLAASLALTYCGSAAIFPAAVCVEGRRTVGADNLEILDAIVIRDPVDVIEDQRHRTTAPEFSLSALLAPSLLATLGKQALLQLSARIRRTLDKNLGKRNWASMEIPNGRARSIEVVSRNPPDLIYVFSQQAVVSPRRAHS